MNLGGVFRPLRFVNGLVDKGINPIIITFEDNENLRKVQNRFDYDLLETLDKRIQVYRIPLEDMGKYYGSKIARFRNTYFNTTDNYYKAWKTNLDVQLPKIIAKHAPRAVFVTCPPFSGAEVGLAVSKKFGLPLILDMRDAWADLSMAPLGSFLHYIYKRNKENNVFKHSDAIVTVTPQLLKSFQNSHPKIPSGKFNLIFNGFDFEIPDRLFVQSRSLSEKKTINIGYTGSFYYSPVGREMMLKPWWKKRGHRILQYTPIKEDWLYRSPYFFLKALKQLFISRPELQERVYFHLIGVTPDWLSSMTDEIGITQNIILHGFQTHQKTLELQDSFDLFLATSEKIIGSDHYCLPSKLFTYLRSGKPVLGFVTKGIQFDFIKQSGLGPISDPDNIAAGSKMIEEIIEQGYKKELNTVYLKQFSNSVAIEELTKIVHKVVNES